jgi:hypothetical protein
MSYESRAYDQADGDPVVVLVTTGTHDVSRLVHALNKGTLEQVTVGRRLVRQVNRHAGGTAALRLLRQHGGPDFALDVADELDAAIDRVAAALEHPLVNLAPDCVDEGCACPRSHVALPGCGTCGTTGWPCTVVEAATHAALHPAKEL